MWELNTVNSYLNEKREAAARERMVRQYRGSIASPGRSWRSRLVTFLIRRDRPLSRDKTHPSPILSAGHRHTYPPYT